MRTCFWFHRNPYERLVSAYKDKALKRDGLYCKLWNNPCQWYNMDSTGILSFKQFVNCIVSKAQHVQDRLDSLGSLQEVGLWRREAGMSLDHHWAPQVHLSVPCHSYYTLISKHEYFELDTVSVLHAFNMTVSDNHLPHHNQSPGVTSLKQWYSQIDRKTMEDIRDLYKLDFELFGYDSMPPV